MNKFALLVFCGFFMYGCTNNKEFIDDKVIIFDSLGIEKIYPTIKSNPYFDSLRCQNGEFQLFYATGELKEKATWLNGKIINENILYFKDGNILSYRFYNVIGSLVYSRDYSKDGNVVKSIGDPLIQIILNPGDSIKRGDSVIAKIYVASPPNCTHRLFGINNKGKHLINGVHKIPYIYEIRIKPPAVSGEYVFPFEIEFNDIKNKSVVKSKDKISITVK